MFGLVPFGSRKDLARKDDGLRSLFDIFNEPFFNSNFEPFTSWGHAGFKVDVKDKGNAYELTADLPGVKKENITLQYENNYLTITAEESADKEEKDGESYIRRERRIGQTTRSFYIDNIDESKVTAEFKDGVLTIDLPKQEESVVQAKRIEIK